MDSFEDSFILYVESGMRKKAEADIEVFRNEHGRFLPVTKDFQAEFCKFILDHRLRKFLCSYLCST